MRKLQLLTAMAIGISASAIGSIQVEAATYNYFVDFSTKEVANFDDYTQTFIEDTYNLELEVAWKFSGSYYFDSCPTAFTVGASYTVQGRPNATGSFTTLGQASLPAFTCTTTTTSYLANVNFNLNQTYLDLIVDDDTNFIEFRSQIVFFHNANTNGRILYLLGYRQYFDLFYNFGTTYLFNYFLSDQKWDFNILSANWTITSTKAVYLQYVYTTAGNDEYYILNSNVSTIGTTRKKYAVDYNMEYFRGESVGAGFTMDNTGIDSALMTASGTTNIGNAVRYYYLNVANNSQAIVDAPEFNFTYEDCGWDVFDIPCFINNGLAYITNDAPIISDAITLLNAGIAMAAQTFGIIGAFTTDNVFGYLILAGFGFIAVRWFLKND